MHRIIEHVLSKHATIGATGGPCAGVASCDGVASPPKPEPVPIRPVKQMPPVGAAQPGVAAASLPKIAGWVARDRNAPWREVPIDPDDPDTCYWWNDAPSAEQSAYEKARKDYTDRLYEERWGKKLRAMDPKVRGELIGHGHLGMGIGAAGTIGALGTLVGMARSSNPKVRGAAMLASAVPGVLGLSAFGSGARKYIDAHSYGAGDDRTRIGFNKDYMKRHGVDVDAIAMRQRGEDSDAYDKAHEKQFNRIYEWSDDDD